MRLSCSPTSQHLSLEFTQLDHIVRASYLLVAPLPGSDAYQATKRFSEVALISKTYFYRNIGDWMGLMPEQVFRLFNASQYEPTIGSGAGGSFEPARESGN